MDAQPREITHGFQERSYRAEILAKGTIVVENDGKSNAHHIINDVPDNEQTEKHVVSGFPKIKQHPDESQRQREHDVTDEPNLFS